MIVPAGRGRVTRHAGAVAIRRGRVVTRSHRRNRRLLALEQADRRGHRQGREDEGQQDAQEDRQTPHSFL